MSLSTHKISLPISLALSTRSHWSTACMTTNIKIIARQWVSSFAVCFFRIGKTIFFETIYHVVLMSSNAQMMWVKTCWIITFMYNLFSVIQGKVKPPKCGEPMGTHSLALIHNHTISMRIFSSGIIPATSFFINNLIFVKSFHGETIT